MLPESKLILITLAAAQPSSALPYRQIYLISNIFFVWVKSEVAIL